MVSTKTIFWEVDAQADFMLPGGKLYVPGAEKILPNVKRLMDAARHGRVFVVSSADAHNPDDPELREWPAHCLKGTAGAGLVPEACAAERLIIPNDRNFAVPENVGAFPQVTIEKNTLDVFDNPHTETLLEWLGPGGTPAFDAKAEFVVFGVATEYCVRCAAEGLLKRGRRVALVSDAIQALDAKKGREVLEKLKALGARLLTTEEALKLVEARA